MLFTHSWRQPLAFKYFVYKSKDTDTSTHAPGFLHGFSSKDSMSTSSTGTPLMFPGASRSTPFSFAETENKQYNKLQEDITVMKQANCLYCMFLFRKKEIKPVENDTLSIRSGAC